MKNTNFIDWCRSVVSSDTHCILDTETTGLYGEVIDLAAITPKGDVLYNSLLKPKGSIEPEARATHHIDEAMIAEAPTIADEWPKICDALAGRIVITYNAKFDSARIKHSLACYNLVAGEVCNVLTFECAMIGYAQHWNAPPRYARSSGPAWQSLSTACYQQGIALDPTAMHRALADCNATLALIRQVAASGENARRYRREA